MSQYPHMNLSKWKRAVCEQLPVIFVGVGEAGLRERWLVVIPLGGS